MLNLLIVDSSLAMGRLMAVALRDEPECHVVGVTTRFQDTLQGVGGCNVVMINATLPDADTLDLIQAIARQHPSVRIVVMDAPAADDGSRYLKSGAHEVGHPDTSLQALLDKARRPLPTPNAASATPHLAIPHLFISNPWISPTIA
jgi:DNA-binding NtrC family response regulator